jgi:hypothetical protein
MYALIDHCEEKVGHQLTAVICHIGSLTEEQLFTVRKSGLDPLISRMELLRELFSHEKNVVIDK